MSVENFTDSVLRDDVWQVLNKSWDNVSVPLSNWQISQLSVLESEVGISCLLRMWFTVQTNLIAGTFCNATWDGHYCWPPTTSGKTETRHCSEAFRESQPFYAPHLEGTAYRICQANGSWLWGNWTNYSECADSYEAFVEKSARTAEEEHQLVTQVQYILFIGSILSLICLITAISIFCCFKSLWCDRVTIHLHLMAALTLRYLLLYIITEAFVWERESNYRDVDWVCKTVLIVYLYATVTSVNWMFIQGVYLNSKLTTNVFDKEAPFKLYYTFGWLTPMPLLAIYGIVMEQNHPMKCWRGYSDMQEIWIILGPIIVALVINLALLINILRILVTKVHRGVPQPDSSDAARCFRRAAKATLILSPILGINNLLFVYNPGGDYNKYYVILNSLFGSTQGVFVAFIYCYLSTEVHTAISRCYRRFLARRNAVRRMQQQRANSLSTSSGVIMEHPIKFFRNGKACCCDNARTSSFQSSVASGQSLLSGSMKRYFVRGITNSRESNTRRLGPTSPFSTRRTVNNGVCPKHRHRAVFLARMSTETEFSNLPGTGRVATAQSNPSCDDVIIPLSELVRT